jgi:hypothetical protein
MATCLTHKIDSNVVELRYAEEECIGQLAQGTAAIAATGVLAFAGQPAAADTITIGAVTLTYTDTTPAAGEIQIGADTAATITATITAINADVSNVTAAPGTGNSIAVTAKTAGAAGNSITTTTVSTNLSFGAGTLTGGADATSPAAWNPLEPNSYGTWGAAVTTSVRNPISRARQRQKGVVTDLQASGSMTQDLTQTNAQDLLQGYLFADTRIKSSYLLNATSGDLSVDVTGNFATIKSVSEDFTTLGIIPGEWIFIGGDASTSQFASTENNGFKRVRSVAAHALVVDKSERAMVADAGTGKAISIYMGRVLKNESNPALIKRRSYQLERTLGSLDGLEPPQSEYLVGAVPSELTLHASGASILTADYAFVATDAEQRTQADGLKPGSRPALTPSDAFNSTSDLRRMNISLAGAVDEAPTPLFGFATEADITINNTLAANKALGVLGAFDITAGNFVVSGNITAYFSDIAAVQAVRQNADVTFDLTLVKDGAGIVIDMPLISLGGGQPNVQLDQPIMLPLKTDAASGAKISPDLDHTILFTFFDTLPALAA